MRISDWSSDVCSSDLLSAPSAVASTAKRPPAFCHARLKGPSTTNASSPSPLSARGVSDGVRTSPSAPEARSEEHTSELQSLMRISYAVFCLKKQTCITHTNSYQ